MTGRQLRGALQRLKLTQSAAARELGVNGRTMRRWIAGDATVPRVVELVIACWQQLGAPHRRTL